MGQAVRHFEIVNLQLADEGRRKPSVVVTCSSCDAKERISVEANPGWLPDWEIQKKLLAKKWLLAPKPENDICGKCHSELKQKGRSPMTNSPSLTIVPPAALSAKADPPRQMSKSDHRAIYDLIKGVYKEADDATGFKGAYMPPYSDNKVAMDLAVPRAWVEEIRKQFFGDAGVNEDMVAYVDQAETFLREATQIRNEAIKFHTDAQAILMAAKAETARIGDVIERLRKIEEFQGKIRRLAAV